MPELEFVKICPSNFVGYLERGPLLVIYGTINNPDK